MSKTIAAFGEILWDILPDGRTLGGAPFNFINRVSGLGHYGMMVSAVGEDLLGAEALKYVKKLGLSAEYIQRKANIPTGKVKVFLNKQKQPDYEIIQKVAYDYIKFVPGLEALTRSVDCIYFGTLAQRERTSRDTLHAFLNRGDEHQLPVKFLDINLRKGCYTVEIITSSLTRANILKLNEEEADQLAKLLKLKGSYLIEIARELVQEYSLKHCIITLGERGAVCYSEDGNCHYDPGYKVDVVDPCGSGDAFSAGFIHQLFEERTVAESIQLGNVLGGIVASQRGATASVSNENIMRFLEDTSNRNYHPEFETFATKEKHHISWKI